MFGADSHSSLDHLRRHHLRAILVSFVVADLLLSNRKRQKVFQSFLCVACVGLSLWETTAIAQVLVSQKTWVLGYGNNAIREFGPGIVFCMPFLMVAALRTQSKPLRAILITAGVYAMLMVLLTGARGAWLAAVGGVFALALLHRMTMRLLAGLAISILVAALVAQLPIGKGMIKQRVEAGWYSGGRTTGTWGPAFEMFLAKPLIGYGADPQIFHTEYDRLKPSHPWWSLPKSLGPHSLYWEVAFAGGLTALLCLLALLARSFMSFVNTFRRLDGYCESVQDDRLLACAGAASLLSAMLFGFVESPLWAPLGLLVGISTVCANRLIASKA